jgi:hypothetical protein
MAILTGMSIAEGTTRETSGWTADDQTFGARLALIRQRMGWGNIARAAKECGVPTDSWRNWEVDGVEPRRLTTIAMAIASKVGCDYLWLVHGPDRGAVQSGARPTTRYAPGARVLAQIGADPGSQQHADIHRPSPTRSVTQTQPLRQRSKPNTPAFV